MTITSSSVKAAELYRQSLELSDDWREAEALEHCKQALALDPKFALALACVGGSTQGAEGLKMLEEAQKLAARLPEAERITVEIELARRKGEGAKVNELLRRRAAVASGDWRAQLELGALLMGERKFDDAIATLRRAAELNPRAGAAYNYLGITYMLQKKWDPAIEALQKYVDLKPNEANPYDTLAEVQLHAGRLEDAETNFRKATEKVASLWGPWVGVACVRFLRGDSKGGREMIAKALDAAALPEQKANVHEWLIWSLGAEGKTKQALAEADKLEKSVENLPYNYAFTPLLRAGLLIDAGRLKDAEKQLALADQRIEAAHLPAANGARRGERIIRAWMLSKGGKSDAFAGLVRDAEADASGSPDDTFAASTAAFVRGMAAMNQKDYKAAAEELSKTMEDYAFFRWQLSIAQEKAGDKAAAEATRAAIRNTPVRDALYLFVHSKVVTKK